MSFVIDLLQDVLQLPYAPWILLVVFGIGVLSLLNTLIEIAIYAFTAGLALLVLLMGWTLIF